ncbi:MAG: hypothetical protein ACMXYM_05110 [Candidatus Woesearchaeota archaeon]
MRIIHYPRLDTILSVETVIRNAQAPLSKNGIDRLLDKQIMRPTLNVILDYLEASGKIARLKEGIVWIFEDDLSETLKERLERSTPA